MSTPAHISARNSLRARVVPPPDSRAGRSVHYAEPPKVRLPRLLRQRERIKQFQRRWKNIKQDLPPQLSRRHIGMISIGGVIGTGLFLGSADALRNGGPIGALLGYIIIGTVVYCLCVSIAEMIAFLPNVGGVVGLADLYVDEAVGFSLGWAAWYNWSVTLPAEITAAAVVVRFWDKDDKIPTAALSAIFLCLAIAVNCFSTRVYGEFEFWFSTLKVITIISIIVVSLILDLGAGKQGFIAFKNWSHPFADEYLGIKGTLGQFLGFWAVLMQASFSFFGSEVPGIAAGEVIDATRNVPRALQRVWIRITLFYVGGIFCAGLLVPANNGDLGKDDGTANSSPFVIALDLAGVKVLPHIINGAILLSAWSAAASDIYISSRFLFFLARCKHAPSFLASLIKHPWYPTQEQEDESSDIESDDENDIPVIDIRRHDSVEQSSGMGDMCNDKENDIAHVEIFEAIPSVPADSIASEGTPDIKPKEPHFVLPLAAVLVSASVGLLAFLGSSKSSGDSAQVAFNWLVAVTSVASLQSWAGMLFTYIRWHQGTVYTERKHKDEVYHDPESQKIMQQIEHIKKHRHPGQPYLAWWAFSICMIVLLTNGWSVFVHNGWRIADIPGMEPTVYDSSKKVKSPVSLFLSSYVPIPFFVLLTFGYKLIHQTKMVKVEEMTFFREDVPEVEEPEPKGKRENFLRWLLAI